MWELQGQHSIMNKCSASFLSQKHHIWNYIGRGQVGCTYRNYQPVIG
jgi:hypothetical protein